MTDQLAILTLVSNANGMGPGHSALVAGGTVWTFEEVKGPMGQAWKIIGTKDYLRENQHRPVVVQQLNEKVNSRDVLSYVTKSIARDDDYATSGVCSERNLPDLLPSRFPRPS